MHQSFSAAGTPVLSVCAGALAVLPLTAHADFAITQLTQDGNPGVMPHRIETPLHLPIDVDYAPGNSDYFFVSQLGGVGNDGADGDEITKAEGRIVLFDRNTGLVDYLNPFLVINDTNLFDPIGVAPEVGLFSTAFHPDFANNGKLYVSVAVNYPGPAPDLSPRDPRNPPFKTVVREYTADPNNLAAGATFSQTVLEVDQPSFNHNGSWMGFNPIESANGEHNLYITWGDGGDQHDPFQYSQDNDSWLGTVLRVNVDGDDFAGDPNRNYAVPADNPFVGEAGLDEIWAYGLRNPWRASFDSETGDFYVGDVGQDTWEEINFLPGDIGPDDDRNFGWRDREGFNATPTGGIGGPAPADNVDPIIAIRHLGGGVAGYEGNSIAGGIVYRGPVEEFYGKYIFADSVSGNIWAIDLEDIENFDPATPHGTLERLNGIITPENGFVSIVSFAEDEEGNLLIVDHGFQGANLGGHLYRLDFVSSAYIDGDFNGSGQVEQGDLDLVLQNWGDFEIPDGWEARSQFSGQMSQAELDLVLQNWGNDDGQPHFITGDGNVPEPAGLAVLAGAALLRRRWSAG